MTMSVGLGRIITDPAASVLVRKALGTLSTPGLLVYDDALTIDDTGRIVLRLNPNGGLSKDESGLAIDSVLNPPDTSILVGVGIDSHWDLPTDGEGRRWNARLTGTAPNYFESGLAIGAEEFSGTSTLGVDLEQSMLCVTANFCQQRLRYDEDNFLAIRVTNEGYTELYSVSDTSGQGFHFLSGFGSGNVNDGYDGGIRINHGVTIEQIIAFETSVSYGGGGAVGATSYFDSVITYTPPTSAYDIRPLQDIVTVIPEITGAFPLPAAFLAWSATITNTNEITLRVAFINVLGADIRNWRFIVHRLS